MNSMRKLLLAHDQNNQTKQFQKPTRNSKFCYKEITKKKVRKFRYWCTLCRIYLFKQCQIQISNNLNNNSSSYHDLCVDCSTACDSVIFMRYSNHLINTFNNCFIRFRKLKGRYFLKILSKFCFTQNNV